MCEIERTLRRLASTPHDKYNKEKAESHKLEVQRLLEIIAVPNTHPNGESVVESAFVLDHSGNTATTTFPENGRFFARLRRSQRMLIPLRSTGLS